MKGKIIGISLGPGDPELITLKALKALNAVDVIFCPGTKSGEGRNSSISGADVPGSAGSFVCL